MRGRTVSAFIVPRIRSKAGCLPTTIDMTPTNDWKLVTNQQSPMEAHERLRLWLVHSLNHRYLNDRGQYTKVGASEHYVFTHETAARSRRDSLLDKFPYAFVYLAGAGSDDVERSSSAKYGDYIQERNEYLTWKSRSFLGRLFSSRPSLSIYDPDSDPLLAPA